jgi:hypothetical protein
MVPHPRRRPHSISRLPLAQRFCNSTYLFGGHELITTNTYQAGQRGAARPPKAPDRPNKNLHPYGGSYRVVPLLSLPRYNNLLYGTMITRRAVCDDCIVSTVTMATVSKQINSLFASSRTHAAPKQFDTATDKAVAPWCHARAWQRAAVQLANTGDEGRTTNKRAAKCARVCR